MQLINQIEKSVAIDNVTGTSYSAWIDITGCQVVSIQAVVDVNTPVAKTCPEADVVVASSSFTVVAHGFTTGLKVAVTTDDTLPDPLTATNYYVISLSADSYQLATSLANALAGTFVVLVDNGTGTTTFTPAAIAGASVKFQKSNDGVNATDVGSPTSITVDAAVWVEYVDPSSRYLRIAYTLTAGRLSSTNYFLGKGPA